MDEAVLCRAFRLPSSDPLHSLRAPVGTDVGEDSGLVGEQMQEEHGHAIQSIVFSGKDKGLADAVPVKAGVQHRLGKVSVGLVVGPHTLALEAAQNAVASQRLFVEAHFAQFRISSE